MIRRNLVSALALVATVALAGTSQAAFISLENAATSGTATTFDVVYNPEGATGVASIDFVATTGVPVVSITGTQVAGIFDLGGATVGDADSITCGGPGTLACVGYGGFNFSGDTPTPGPLLLGTLTVDVGANPSTTVIQGVPPTIFQQAPATVLPNNTVDPLATIGAGQAPEPGALVLLGMSLGGVAFLRRRGPSS